LNTDGSVDSSFATTASNFVLALAVQTDGRILVGGSFTEFAGTTRTGLVRLNADGSLDTSFASFGFNSTVNAVTLQPDGKIIAGGIFTSYLDASNVSTTRTRVARLTSTGALDTTFSTAANSTVNAI